MSGFDSIELTEPKTSFPSFKSLKIPLFNKFFQEYNHFLG